MFLHPLDKFNIDFNEGGVDRTAVLLIELSSAPVSLKTTLNMRNGKRRMVKNNTFQNYRGVRVKRVVLTPGVRIKWGVRTRLYTGADRTALDAASFDL